MAALAVVIAGCAEPPGAGPDRSAGPVYAPATLPAGVVVTTTSVTTPTTTTTTTTTIPSVPMPIPVVTTIIEVSGGTVELESGMPVDDPYHLAVREGAEAAAVALGITGYRIVLTADVEHLARRYREATNVSASAADEVMASSGAVAFPGWLFVNPSQMHQAGPDDYFRTTIHEVIHLHQYALAAPPGSSNPSDALANMRPPNWLIEGTAQFLSARIAEERRPGIVAAYEMQMNAALEPFDGDLSRYELDGIWDDDHAYEVSAAAVRHLVSLAGVDGVSSEYWAARSRGGNWKVTFETVFGLSVDAFYESFRQASS